MPLLPRFNAALQSQDDARKLGRIILESQAADVPKTVTRATLPGDNRRLRGIPCIARGVAGVSPGTNPSSVVGSRRAR
jgi:hypothetical protein